MKQLFDDPAYRPDMIKFYPCMVAPGTALYHQYQQGKFIPISTEEAAERLVPIKEYTPEYCRIQRIQRDVPTKYWTAGVGMTNFRQFINEQYHPKCRCIRCREPRGKPVNWDQGCCDGVGNRKRSRYPHKFFIMYRLLKTPRKSSHYTASF